MWYTDSIELEKGRRLLLVLNFPGKCRKTGKSKPQGKPTGRSYNKLKLPKIGASLPASNLGAV